MYHFYTFIYPMKSPELLKLIKSILVVVAILWICAPAYEARVGIEDFRRNYNTLHAGSKLGYRSPADYAAQLSRFQAPVGLRPTFDVDRKTATYTALSIYHLDLLSE